MKSRLPPVSLPALSNPVTVRNPEKKVAIPTNWINRGFPNHHLYVRRMTMNEKRLMYKVGVMTEPLNWDKVWYGAFQVAVSTPIFFCDSLTELQKLIRHYKGKLIWMN